MSNSQARHRVLTVHFTQASVLALNSVLLESASFLMDGFREETPFIICKGIRDNNVSL